VPSRDPKGCRRGYAVGLKSPGLEDGVLLAVFEIVDDSIVEVQHQDDCRHVRAPSSYADVDSVVSARRRHCIGVVL